MEGLCDDGYAMMEDIEALAGVRDMPNLITGGWAYFCDNTINGYGVVCGGAGGVTGAGMPCCTRRHRKMNHAISATGRI